MQRQSFKLLVSWSVVKGFIQLSYICIGDRGGSNSQFLEPQSSALPFGYDHSFLVGIRTPNKRIKIFCVTVTLQANIARDQRVELWLKGLESFVLPLHQSRIRRFWTKSLQRSRGTGQDRTDINGFSVHCIDQLCYCTIESSMRVELTPKILQIF